MVRIVDWADIHNGITPFPSFVLIERLQCIVKWCLRVDGSDDCNNEANDDMAAASHDNYNAARMNANLRCCHHHHQDNHELH